MRYDVAQGAYFMDKPIAMCPADTAGVINQLKWQQIWLRVRNIFGQLTGVVYLALGLAAIGYAFYAFSSPGKTEDQD